VKIFTRTSRRRRWIGFWTSIGTDEKGFGNRAI
jgi:hypothetical protein